MSANAVDEPTFSLTFDVDPTPSTIVLRTATGAVAVGPPTAAQHAATRGYVDSVVAASPVQVVAGTSRAGLDPDRPVMFVSPTAPPIGGVAGARPGDLWERA